MVIRERANPFHIDAPMGNRCSHARMAVVTVFRRAEGRTKNNMLKANDTRPKTDNA